MIRSAKIMLLGDIAVGKSSLAKRLVFDRFEASYKTTIGVDVMTHSLELPDGEMRLVIWDTDGDFSQRIFSTTYVAGAAGAIIVADATRPATIDRMHALADAFEARFPARPMTLVLNKIDIAPARALSAAPARPMTRTSALTGEGVSAAFEQLGLTIARRGL